MKLLCSIFFLVGGIFLGHSAEVTHPPVTLQQVTNIVLSLGGGGSGGVPGSVVSSGGAPAAFMIPVYVNTTGTNVTPKAILAGSNISVVTNNNGFTINGTFVGTLGAMINSGASAAFKIPVYSDTTSTNLTPKSILAGTGLVLATNSTGFTFAVDFPISPANILGGGNISITVPGNWSVNGLGADTGTNFVLTQNSVNANEGNYGPTSGGPGSPAFRPMDNRDIPNGIIVASAKLNATGTPNSTTILYGDNRWAPISGFQSSTGIVNALAMFDATGAALTNTWIQFTNLYLLPITNNSIFLGSTTNRFKSLAAVDINLSGQITSIFASGSGPPFIVASTTEVANLNAQKWGGKTLDYLNTGFILGDMQYWDASGNPKRLFPNQNTNIAFLVEYGSGNAYPNIGNAPFYMQITAGTNIVISRSSLTNFTINSTAPAGMGGSLNVGYFPVATGASTLGDSPMTLVVGGSDGTVNANHLRTKRTVIHYDDSQTLNVIESFSYIDNFGLTNQQVLTLPPGVEGLTYTIQVVNTNGIKVIPDTTDIIRIRDGFTTNGTAGGYIDSSTKGDSITLVYASGVWETLDAGCGWVTHPVAGTPCVGGGGGGTVGTVKNTGSSAVFQVPVYSDTTGTNVSAKSILGGTGITITTNSTGFTLTATTNTLVQQPIGDVITFFTNSVAVDTTAAGVIVGGVTTPSGFPVFTVPSGRIWITLGVEGLVTTGTTADYNAHQISMSVGVDSTYNAMFDSQTWFTSGSYDGVNSFETYNGVSSATRKHAATAGQVAKFFLYDNQNCTDATVLTVGIRGYFIQ